MRTKCHKIEHRISGYIDGTLSERQRAAVASHIRSCQSCQREVADLKKTQHLLKNFYVEPDASDAYYAQFTAKLQQRIEQSAPTAPHQVFGAAATRLGWQLLTQIHRYTDHFRPSRFISIRQTRFTVLRSRVSDDAVDCSTVLLTQISLHNNGEHVHLHPTPYNPP